MKSGVARSLLTQGLCSSHEDGQLSVTFDVSAGASLQTPPPKLAPPDPTASDSFAALVDSNLPAPPSDPPVSGTTPLSPSSSGSSGGSLAQLNHGHHPGRKLSGVSHPADDATAEPESAGPARYQSIHPTARRVRFGRAEVEDQRLPVHAGFTAA